MIKHRIAALGLTAMVGATVPAGLRAQQELCAPTADHVCVVAKFTLTGNNTLNVFLFNGASGEGVNWQSVLTKLGIGALPTAGTWSLAAAYFNDWNGTSLVSNGATALTNKGGWTFDTSNPELGLTIRAGADGPGGNGGISTCDGPTGGSGTKYRTCEGDGTGFGPTDDWFEFSFQYSAGGLTQTTLNNLTWGFKTQSVEALHGQSFECNTTVTNPTADKYCTSHEGGDGLDGPKEVAPEPATMGLLAFGLVGLAMASRRRRTQ